MSARTTVKSIQDIMRQDVGVDGDAQRISQLCWMFFLKIIDDQDRELELFSPSYRSPIPRKFQWRTWAANPEGLTGDGLLAFINLELFPTLKDLPPTGQTGDRGRVVRDVFEDAYNYMKSGHLMRQVVNKIDGVDFNNLAARQHFGEIYEQILNDLQSAGNAGEYYTPRAVTAFMADRIDPRPGEILLDPACGTGGFLTCAIRHMRERYVKRTEDEQRMQDALRAVEKKQLPHMLCVTNMLLHGIEDPSFVRHDNTLARPYISYGRSDRVDIVLTNPPFGGKEEDGIESNFPKQFQTRVGKLPPPPRYSKRSVELIPGDCGLSINEPDLPVPSGWTWVPLVQVARIESGHTPSRNRSDWWNGDVPWMGLVDARAHNNRRIFDTIQHTNEAGLANSAARLLPEGTVCFSRTASVGYVVIMGRPMATSQDFVNWVPTEAISSEWLQLVMIAERSAIARFSKGAVHQTIYYPAWLSMYVALPPIAEQHRIVAKVDELMALCDRLEAARNEREGRRDRLVAASLHRLSQPAEEDGADAFRANARFYFNQFPRLTTRPDHIKQLRQTILNLAVRGRLVPQNPNDEPASELSKRILAQPWTRKRKVEEIQPDRHAVAAAFPLPKGWEWSSVSKLVRPNETVTYGILKPEWVTDGVPTVRVTEMKTGTIDINTLPKCDQARAAKFAKTTLTADDLLISKDGTIGKTAFVPPELAGGNITQHMLRFPITPLVNRFFIRISIDAPFCQSWMAGETKGVALQGINVGDFRRMLIPLPPLTEQHRIVAKVDELMGLCDRLEASLAETEGDSRRLLEAVLHEALVPVNEVTLAAAS